MNETIPRDPDPTTPGRPTESGSRQQTVPDQNSQSGSNDLDREATRHSGDSGPTPAKPDNVK